MNRLMLCLSLCALAVALGTPGALANDRWEFNNGGCCGADNGPWQIGASENELTPGSEQDHDMEGVADEDWMVLSQQPYSSYEVRIDGMSDFLTYTPTADILAVDLVQSDGTIVATGYTMNPIGIDRRVTFQNNAATTNNDQHMRISSAACNPCLAAESGYTIRLFDTTYLIPRFNNSGTQTTVMILQNSLGNSVAVDAHFFNPAGTFLATHSVTIAAHGTAVVSTNTIPGVAGTGGSIVVTNTGGYGALSGKAVALEPGTGFTFDTVMVARPQ